MPRTTLQQLKEKLLKDQISKEAYYNESLDVKDVEVIFHPEKTKANSDER